MSLIRCWLALRVGLCLHGAALAQNVQFGQSSSPLGIVNQTTYPLPGDTVSTVRAPDNDNEYTFTYWTGIVAGRQRMTDPSGYSANPATFVITGATAAVAQYVLTAQDTAGDGIPDWWKLRYFDPTYPQGVTLQSLSYPGAAGQDPDQDGYTNTMEYHNGTNPNVAETYAAGGVSRRRSAPTTVVINTANYALLQQVSNPPGVLSQTTVVAKGSTVNLLTAPTSAGDYSFTGWLINGDNGHRQQSRVDKPTQLQPIPLTVTADTTVVAWYVHTADQTAGNFYPDWQELFYFNALGYGPNDDFIGDGFTLTEDQQYGFSPVVSNQLVQGGVSRRRSAMTTVVINTANYALLQQVSNPPGVLSQTSVVAKGTTVNLLTAPTGSGDYSFTGWLIDGDRAQRVDKPTQIQPIPLTVTADTTVVAWYVHTADQTTGNFYPDWQELFYFNALGYGPNDDFIGDGFTLAQDQQYGFSPVVSNQLVQGGLSRRRGGLVNVAVGATNPGYAYGGVSRRRSVLTAVNAVFLPAPPALVVNAVTFITPTSAMLNARVNPIGSPTSVFFQWAPQSGTYAHTVQLPDIASGLLLSTPQSTALSGLTPNTTYYFIVVATNTQGTTQSPENTFATLPNNYSTWAAQHGLGGPTEDPHGVGVPNLMVFALGLNPGSPDRTQIPQPQLSSGSMVLNFMQPTDVSGLTYSAEWSTTLQAGDWHAATDTGSNPQHIFSVPIGANTRLFMRLKVMSP